MSNYQWYTEDLFIAKTLEPTTAKKPSSAKCVVNSSNPDIKFFTRLERKRGQTEEDADPQSTLTVTASILIPHLDGTFTALSAKQTDSIPSPADETQMKDSLKRLIRLFSNEPTQTTFKDSNGGKEANCYPDWGDAIAQVIRNADSDLFVDMLEETIPRMQ